MSRIIEAKAVISGEDRTGKMFDSIKKHFDEIGKGAKVAKNVGELGKQLDAAARGMRQIQDFRATQAGFARARTTFRSTQAEVTRLAKELDGARKAAAQFEGVRTFGKAGAIASEMATARKRVGDLERQFTSAQRAVKAAAGSFDAQASALKDAKRAVEGSGISVGKLVAEEGRLKAAIEGVNAAYVKQAGLQHTSHRDAIAAGMGSADVHRQRQDAASRRMVEAMGAPARAAERRRAVEETHRAKRASAAGDLAAGMGAAGRPTLDEIEARVAHRVRNTEASRRMLDGMGAPARALQDERDRLAREHAEGRSQRSADRREAAGTVAAGAGLYLGHKGKEIGLEAINAAGEFDYAVRYQHAVTDVSEADQQRLLMPQAKRIGQETKFSNRDIVEAQTATMQGLPFNDPALKAEVGAAIVDHSRYYAVLFKTGMERSSEGIRSFLQNTNKDISTPGKAVAEAQRATNLIVKASKLGGANDEDAQQFLKFGLPTMTQAGFKDTTALSIFSTARRSGLKGDEAGVFGRAMASKLISPTRDGREAEIMAGIDRSKFQKMPEQLSGEAFDKIAKGRFGVQLSKGQRGRLGAMFGDGDLVTDRENFIKRVSDVVSESFDKVQKGPNKGKMKARDADKVAKLANDFHRMSVESTDVEGLWNAHLESPTFTTALRNKFYTDKHGGKAGMIASHGDQFRQDRDELLKTDKTPFFARDKAMYLTQGLGGSIDNAKGSYETAVLNLGTKNAPMIQAAADGLAAVGDAIANLPDKVVQAGTLLGLGAGTGAVSASALAMWGQVTGSAVLKGMGASTATGTLAGTGLGTVALGGYAASEYGRSAVRDRDFADPYLSGGMLGADPAGYGFGAAIVHAGDLPGYERTLAASARAIPSMLGGGRLGGLAPSIGSATASFGLTGPQAGAAGLVPPVPVFEADKIAAASAQVAAYKGELAGLVAQLAGLRASGEGAFSPEAGGLEARVDALRAKIDASGQITAINNTLEKQTNASAASANGGKPIEATVKPDQITAKISEIPPVTGTATVTVDQNTRVTVEVNADWVKATARAEAKSAVASIPLASSGARPGAVSMPGAATTPGAK